MTHTSKRSLCSLTAIAAAGLLLSTPALAQSAQPPDTQPQAATTPEPQPEVPPPPQPDPTPTPPEAVTTPAPVMTANPVVQALPDSSQTPPPAPTATTTPHTIHTVAPKAVAKPASTAPTPATREAITAPQPAAQPSPTLTRRDPAGLYTADGPPAATAPAPAATQSPYVRYWPLEAGGVIILLGLIAYAAARRREEEVEEEYPPVTVTPEPEAAPAPRAPITAHNDSPVLTGPVPTGAAREALLKRMVDAPPDAANPFTTRKARMHRARLILQTRKQALLDQAVETFDWRTYRPSLTHPTLGTAKGKKETIK
jgi:hypothetical protein